MEKRIKNLIQFCQGIYKGGNGKTLYEKYLPDINTIKPQDIFLIEYEQLEMGISPKEMLTYLDKLINVFYKKLSEYHWKKPKKGTFLHDLMQENIQLNMQLESIKEILINKDFDNVREELNIELHKLENYEAHLLKLEYILFPSMEKQKKVFEGLKIMWSLHDESRKALKSVIWALKTNEDKVSIYAMIGRLFFKYYGLVQKQELIMFPVATEVLNDRDFEIMYVQSFEYGFSFIQPPKKPDIDLKSLLLLKNSSDRIQTETGNLLPDQVVMMLNKLPVDITLVDEYDKVTYFSNNEDRIFPRSPAIIGRDVRNCHPPESVHVVEEIMNNFKQGKRDTESFWIQMHGKFIMIQYFALRDDEGVYKGTLEVSQEISELRQLEGEKRLLTESN